MFYPYFCQNLGVPGNSVRPLAITTRRTFMQIPAGNYLFRCSFLFTLYSSSTNQIKKPGKVALGCCCFFAKASVFVCLQDVILEISSATKRRKMSCLECSELLNQKCWSNLGNVLTNAEHDVEAFESDQVGDGDPSLVLLLLCIGLVMNTIEVYCDYWI